MKRIAIITLLVISVLGINSGMTHVENRFLPKGCGSCHVGHGMQLQPMLDKSEEDFCYKCHGSEENQTEMVSTGKLAGGVPLKNIEAVFNKPYRHPVEDGLGHSPTERLPLDKGSSPTHAECVDCHNPHERTSSAEKQLHQVSGYSLTGQYKEDNVYEYEICLKCHAEYIGFNKTNHNLLSEFATSVKSQHPVTRPATGTNRTSLVPKAAVSMSMKCSDCHTNDDPDGPRGPHGSNYKYMLSGNYDTEPNTIESPYSYEFCYSCHERTSILGDNSFPYHRMHILGDPLKNIPGTSCYTCHSSHSSKKYPFLIDFNPKAVASDRTNGIIDFRSTGANSGECYLNCHGHDHSPARY